MALGGQSITGRVLDAGSGAGLAAVRVDLLSWSTNPRQTLTDGAGAFRFDGLASGEYRIHYDAPQFHSAEERTLVRLAAGRDLHLEAQLVAWSTVRGRVVDPAGKPMPNARLELRSSGITANGRLYHRTSWGAGGGALLTDAPTPMFFQGLADARGEFTVRLFPGAYALTALAAPDAPPPPLLLPMA